MVTTQRLHPRGSWSNPRQRCTARKPTARAPRSRSPGGALVANLLPARDVDGAVLAVTEGRRSACRGQDENRLRSTSLISQQGDRLTVWAENAVGPLDAFRRD